MHSRREKAAPSPFEGRPTIRYRPAEATGGPEPQSARGCPELLLAASPAGLHHHGETTITLRSSETGVADLGRLVVFNTDHPPLSNVPLGLSDEIARITSIEIFNAHQRARGLGEVRAPAGVFSTLRRQCSIDLGKVRLAPSDTLAVTIRSSRVSEFGGEALVGITVPFLPDTPRHLFRSSALSREPHVYLASPVARPTRHEPFQLTLAMEEDGVVDLESLQLSGVIRSGSDLRDPLPATVVESIQLPSGEDLIIGNGDCYGRWDQSPVACPATLFTHLGRKAPWSHLGRLQVQRGQQLTIRLRACGIFKNHPKCEPADKEPVEVAVFSAGLRFYPSVQAGNDERIQASEFFVD